MGLDWLEQSSSVSKLQVPTGPGFEPRKVIVWGKHGLEEGLSPNDAIWLVHRLIAHSLSIENFHTVFN